MEGTDMSQGTTLNEIAPQLRVNRQPQQAGGSPETYNTIVDIGDSVTIGGDRITVMAGPCSVESKEQIVSIARELKGIGIGVLRGGAFKPRTSPYDFQGLGKEGLEYLRQASRATGLKVITEVLDPRDVTLVAGYADIIQIGARSMQNYPLLREVGNAGVPVLLKRGKSATYREFLLAAEYNMVEGNERVILCERGIRTLINELRFTLDLSAVPYLKQRTHLPVIVDPSHGTGSASLVIDMTKAAIACGADGVIIETHLYPRESKSDAAQTISTDELRNAMPGLIRIAEAVGRRMDGQWQ
jgi:3-deoxy-7-phosphoheptulonate synthase